jgi:hypothetical protein
MPGGGLGRIIRSRDCVAGTPKDSHLQTPPSAAEERGWPAEPLGSPCEAWEPPAKKSDPDGSPLEDWYLPCGLFLPF